jgi:peptidyl-prolyl cis-trans isomerase C
MSFALRSLILPVVLMLAVGIGMAQQPSSDKPPDAAHDVLAVVNGQQITKMDFDQLMRQYLMRSGGRMAHNKGRIMRNLVTLELLAQEGKKLHLDQDPAVQAQIRLRTNDILARSVVQKYVAENAVVTEEAIRKYYEASKDTYTVGEQITASHILVKTEREAQEVLRELKQGKDFASVARAKSIGPSASKGGALGTFGRGRMVPAFEKAAFALKVGEISAPVHTQFGYHIIKVTNRIAARTKPLDEVRGDIRNTLISRYVDTLIADLRRKAKIQIMNPDYVFE